MRVELKWTKAEMREVGIALKVHMQDTINMQICPPLVGKTEEREAFRASCSSLRDLRSSFWKKKFLQEGETRTRWWAHGNAQVSIWINHVLARGDRVAAARLNQRKPIQLRHARKNRTVERAMHTWGGGRGQLYWEQDSQLLSLQAACWKRSGNELKKHTIKPPRWIDV